MARTTMTALIASTRALLHDPDAAIFSDDQIEDLLDAHSMVVSLELRPAADYLTHRTIATMLEDGVSVYAGVYRSSGGLSTEQSLPDPSAFDLANATLLVETTDYTIDTARGIVTTVLAEDRPMWIVGRSYDINGAAADGWEQIATSRVDSIDFGGLAGNYKDSQYFSNALVMSDRLRRRAWPGVY